MFFDLSIEYLDTLGLITIALEYVASAAVGRRCGAPILIHNERVAVPSRRMLKRCCLGTFCSDRDVESSIPMASGSD